MAVIGNYDAKDCTIVINGTTYITGLGEDMVTFEKDEQYIEPVAGAQGDVVVNVINNDLYTLTLSLLAVSPSKKVLLNLARRKQEFSILVTNKSLGERFGGSRAMVKSAPELSLGAEAEDREFEIAVFNGTIESI